MATSTYPAARAALVSTLERTSGLAGVAIFNGAPMVAEPEFLCVLNGSSKQAIAVMGRDHPRDEDFRAFVLVHTENSDPSDAVTPLDRVFLLMGEVETALRTDPSLGGVVRIAELDGWELEELQGPESRGCSLLVTVRCQARI